MIKKIIAILFMIGASSSACHSAEIVGIGGKCLDVKGGSSANSTEIILYRCHGGENQQWEVVNGAIKGIGGKCLDVKGGGSADSTQIILYSCHGGDNQRWIIR